MYYMYIIIYVYMIHDYDIYIYRYKIRCCLLVVVSSLSQSKKCKDLLKGLIFTLASSSRLH